MTKPQRSRGAAAGWLLTFAGTVALGTLAYSILSTSYRRERLFALLQGKSTYGIGVESWLLGAAPLLIIGFGVALIAATKARSPAR